MTTYAVTNQNSLVRVPDPVNYRGEASAALEVPNDAPHADVIALLAELSEHDHRGYGSWTSNMRARVLDSITKLIESDARGERDDG